MSDFVHLHTHSHYSILDGVSKIPEIIAKAKSDGQSAIALTDHGNMFGAMDFYRSATNVDIKPIFGVEFYIAPTSRFEKIKDAKYYHLVLLAKDYTGYRNLMALSSIGYTEGFYSKPRIDKDILREYSEGLVALSACVGGEIPQMILKQDDIGLKVSLDWYIDTFGKENFFLEIQDHKLDDERIVARRMLNIAKTTDLKIVATNDAHYVERKDAILQELMFCIRDKKSLSDLSRFRYETDEFYLKSTDEMKILFSGVPQAISNTVLVSEMCNFDLKPVLEKLHLPVYKLPKGQTADSYLKKLSYDGLNKRFNTKPTTECIKRLEFELDMIRKMGFSNYFLVVWDFVNFAIKQGIMVGPGRGSAAGAIVAYTLGITNVDPIHYALFFERFLNPERVSMPDIDIDFEYTRRDEVKEYIRSSYGYNKTADVITFGYLKPRAALKDVGRALDIPLFKVNELTKTIDNVASQKALIDLITGTEKVDKIPELADMRYNGSDEEKTWMEYSIRLDGTIRQIGTHASALIISEDILTDVVPLSKDVKSGTVLTQFEGKHLEDNGLLKMDILGLKTLSLIKDCLARIHKNHYKEIDLDLIPLDDQKVYRLFWNGNTMGVFQFESDPMTAYLRQLKPTCIDDLIAMNALFRPGPMDNIPSYIKRKHGLETVDCFHKNLEPILESTYGIIVFQEQVMQIGQVLAGFSLSKADMLRRAMAKKKQKELDKIRPDWVNGAVERGYPKELAEKLFDLLIPFSSYAFNKSHSAAYSILAYQTVYLKTYYSVEFMAALLTLNMDKSEDVQHYSAECESLGIEILSPDVNYSKWGFREKDRVIIYGFGGIKGLGETFIDSLVRERDIGGEFSSFDDFVDRMMIYDEFKKSAVEILLKSGAMNSLFDAQKILQEKAIYLENLDSFIRQKQKNQKDQDIGQMGLFGGGDNGGFDVHINRNIPALTLIDDFKNELQVFGYYFSGKIFYDYNHKLGIVSEYKDELCNLLKPGTPVHTWGYISDVLIRTGARNSEYAIFFLNNGINKIRFFVFDRYNDKSFTRYKNFLKTNNFVTVRFTVSESKRGGNQYEITDMKPIASLKQERFFQLHIFINNSLSQDEVRLNLDKIKSLSIPRENKGPLRIYLHFNNSGHADTIISSQLYSIRYTPDLMKTIIDLPTVKSVWMF